MAQIGLTRQKTIVVFEGEQSNLKNSKIVKIN